jgi:hypothetical protein
MEINAPRYARLFANAAAEGRTGRTGAAAAARATVGVGSMAAKSAALYGLVHLFNASMHPGEDDEFEEGRLKLILGKDSQGRVFGIRFQGAFSDALSWAGRATSRARWRRPHRRSSSTPPCRSRRACSRPRPARAPIPTR